MMGKSVEELSEKEAQCQSEKKYSKKDMIEFGNQMQIVKDVDCDGNVKFFFNPKDAIEQFKKK